MSISLIVLLTIFVFGYIGAQTSLYEIVQQKIQPGKSNYDYFLVDNTSCSQNLDNIQEINTYSPTISINKKYLGDNTPIASYWSVSSFDIEDLIEDSDIDNYDVVIHEVKRDNLDIYTLPPEILKNNNYYFVSTTYIIPTIDTGIFEIPDKCFFKVNNSIVLNQ